MIPSPFLNQPAQVIATYAIGTILHGNNTLIGNLWIITQDQSNTASLLWDGKLKMLCSHLNSKVDRMSLGMRIATPSEVAATTGGLSFLPRWAQDLILNPKPAPLLTPPSTYLAPAVLAAVDAALGNIVTDRAKLLDKGLIKVRDLDICPSVGNGVHDFQPYYGFTDTYEYCIYCDTKRGFPK